MRHLVVQLRGDFIRPLLVAPAGALLVDGGRVSLVRLGDHRGDELEVSGARVVVDPVLPDHDVDLAGHVRSGVDLLDHLAQDQAAEPVPGEPLDWVVVAAELGVTDRAIDTDIVRDDVRGR